MGGKYHHGTHRAKEALRKMRYLFNHWESVVKEINGRNVFLFLDYDGTLVPIADTPQEAAHMPEEQKRLVTALSCLPECKIAIISGRPLEDIKDIAGIQEIIYVGNHGFEIEGPKIKYKKQEFTGYRQVLEAIKGAFNKKLSAAKGVLIEDKGFTLALHYRLADDKNIPAIKNIFNEITIPYVSKEKIRVRTGKMLLEIRPPVDWDKGKVVLWLLARQRFILKDEDVFPVYIGDDATDEDAFKVLKNKGLTIVVDNPPDSCAQYYVKDTLEVGVFLEKARQLLVSV